MHMFSLDHQLSGLNVGWLSMTCHIGGKAGGRKALFLYLIMRHIKASDHGSQYYIAILTPHPDRIQHSLPSL